jgi:photosystem II stability/assembly factor-like uncharacterized protein
MSSEPVSSNSNRTFTLDPYDNLTVKTTYKTRVTTGVKDTAGNTLSSQYETSNGYKTSGLFVVVGTSGTILTSSDNGTIWTSRTSGTTKDIHDITYGNGIFVAVGTDDTILTSSDNGISWTSSSSTTGLDLNGVTNGNNLFVLAGL